MTYEEQELRAEILSVPFCEVCGKILNRYGTPQLGHRINQSKMNLKKYGKSIIHHRLNLAPTCGLKCNQKASLYGKPESERKLVEKIRKELDKK